MTTYVYTNDTPSTDIQENKRLGFRTPRSILLPPYLTINNQYFTAFTDSIDNVFDSMVDVPTEILGNLRNMWVTNPTLENNQIAESQLIPFEAWSQPEREILVKQVNFLGMKLQNAGVVSNDAYQTISRWVGQYWFGKGTQSFIDFINYCLSSSLTVTKLWTQDYEIFVPEGDPSIGIPIWEGGTWYPTTHVAIIASGGLQSLDIQTLVNFFYEIANYNLVLDSVDLSFTIPIVDHIEDGYTDATVVALGLWADSVIVMSNLVSYGADSPPIFDVSPDIPTSAYSTQPENTDLSAVYLLSQPTAWIMDGQNRRFPVYSGPNQLPTEGSDLPTSVCGNPSTDSTTGGYSLIFGPVNWIQVPGSSRTTARIPSFTTVPVERTAGLSELPTQIVGNQRANLLVNPTGFAEVIEGSGVFSPYWID